MGKIYLDNAATSFPKAPGVVNAVVKYMEDIGCNVNRGGYAGAYSAAETVLETRERLCGLFHFDKPRNVIFTANVTSALNQLLKGFLKAGDHVVTSAVEHNAVMRPLHQLAAQGVSYDIAACDKMGRLSLSELERKICAKTVLVVLAHASNVCGTILPVGEVGELCRRRSVFLVVDSAQTAGTEPIDMADMGISALAFTGHKGLLGPQGLGGFLVTDAFAERMQPLLSGGTGSFSELDSMPPLLPDRFEAGTPNLPGIFGLHAALCFLQEKGIKDACTKERELTRRLLAGLKTLPGAALAGLPDAKGRTAVVSVDFTDHDNAEIAFLLDQRYGIMTRCGLHCAPYAHKTLGTFPQGTVRFSPGIFTKLEEIDETIEALREILGEGCA